MTGFGLLSFLADAFSYTDCRNPAGLCADDADWLLSGNARVKQELRNLSAEILSKQA